MGQDRHKFWRPSSSGTVPTISPLDTLQDGGERCLRLEDLLPGIRNEITLDKIASKMSWKDFHVLSAVSRGWRHAIRSRQVYDARVRSQTRETLALISYGTCRFFCRIALYCTRDSSCYPLPPIPSLSHGGVPLCSECVSLDGKVYVLGGLGKNSYSREVYVLDLAGQRQWKQCASMRVPRCRLKCGVINGKIFAFGGSALDDYCVGEVYDPKENTWSPIRTLMCEDVAVVTVEALGQKLFLYGYTIPHKDIKFSAYHPVKDEWGELKPFDRPREIPFVALSSLHSMSADDIHIHGLDRNSWTQIHTISFAGSFRSTWGDADVADDSMLPLSVKVVEDELLVLMQRYDSLDCVHLLHGKGFSGDKKEIQLEKIPLDYVDFGLDPELCSICLLQL